MQTVMKFLEIKNFQKISDDIYDYVANRTEILDPTKYCFFNHVQPKHILQHTPSLANFLESNRLSPTVTAIIIVPPGLQDTLHTDVLGSYFRMLWPIKNCQGSLTRMFDVPREYLQLVNINNHANGDFDSNHASSNYCRVVGDQQWPLITEFELIQPVVMDTGVAHEIHYPVNAKGYRISFTIGFDMHLPISNSINAWQDLGF